MKRKANPKIRMLLQVLLAFGVGIGVFWAAGTVAYAWCTMCTCKGGYWDNYPGQSCRPGSGPQPCNVGCGGHDWYDCEYKSATCTEQGYKKKRCSICNEVKVTETYPALGHAWGGWHEISSTQHRRNCGRGDASETRSHNYGSFVTTDDNGYHYHTCTTCGRRESIPNPYTVTFFPNGATNRSDNTTQNFTYTVSQMLAENPYSRSYDVIFRANYSGGSDTTLECNCFFAGWNTNSEGTGTAYANRQPVVNLTPKYNGNVNLYAIWHKGVIKTPTPIRTGYLFVGWFTAASGGTKVAGANDDYSVSADTTLYAHWEPIRYKVHYNDPTATSGATTPNPSEHVYDLIKPLSPNGYQREYTVRFNYNDYDHTALTSVNVAYSFLGWSVENRGTISYTDRQNVINLTTEDGKQLEFYAVWQSNYTVLPANPSRPGYDFEGWFTDPVGGRFVGQPGDNFTPTGDITLYCHWKAHVFTFVYHSGDTPDKTHSQTISYNDSGRVADKKYILDVAEAGFRTNLLEGQYYPDTNIPITMTRELLGWSLNANYDREHSLLASAVDFHVGDDITNYTTENGKVIHVYAVWKDVQPSVTGYVKNISARDATNGTNIFRAGEFGALNIRTDGYAMKATVKYPEEWKNYDSDTYRDVVYIISDDVNTVAKKWETTGANQLEFQVPINEGIAASDQTYFFTVIVTNKYGKNATTIIGSVPSTNSTQPGVPEPGRTNPPTSIPLEIRRGSVVDKLRTRLR